MRVPVHEWQLNGVEMAEQRKRKRFNSLRLEKENVFKIYIRVSMLSLSLSFIITLQASTTVHFFFFYFVQRKEQKATDPNA